MVKSGIISKLSQRIHGKLKKPELEKILKIILETITLGVKENQATEIRGFGRFKIKKIREKLNARNPSTGEKIYSPEKISLIFKMGKELKEKINNNRKK